jgi:HEXXH motif-containing protein
MVSGPAGAFAIARGRLVRRATIPGSPILLAPVVVSRPRSLRVGRPDPALAPRFAAALRLLEAAWPEARAMVLRHTVMVVPVREPGTVSWSLAARPGVSFVNPYGKTILDLADDLVHESAHHRLHDLQEARRLLRPGPETEEVQAFDSPWRRARRPLHGILHGFFTFLHRLELLIRVREAARARPGALRPYLKGVRAAFITEEIRKERRMVLASLADLRRAAREGLLTAAGRKFLGSLAAGAARLNASPRPPRAGRATGRAGGRGRSRTRRRARRR